MGSVQSGAHMSLTTAIKAHLKQHGITAKARKDNGPELTVIWVTVEDDLVKQTRELVREFESQVYAIFVQS